MPFMRYLPYWLVFGKDVLPQHFQKAVEVSEMGGCDTVHINLRVRHQGNEVLTCGNLTQQPVVDAPTFSSSVSSKLEGFLFSVRHGM